MIKAEYDREQCGISCTLKVHCKPELQAELLLLLNECFKHEPDATLDVIDDFMNILKEKIKNESTDRAD